MRLEVNVLLACPVMCDWASHLANMEFVALRKVAIPEVSYQLRVMSSERPQVKTLCFPHGGTFNRRDLLMRPANLQESARLPLGWSYTPHCSAELRRYLGVFDISDEAPNDGPRLKALLISFVIQSIVAGWCLSAGSCSILWIIQAQASLLSLPMSWVLSDVSNKSARLSCLAAFLPSARSQVWTVAATLTHRSPPQPWRSWVYHMNVRQTQVTGQL